MMKKMKNYSIFAQYYDRLTENAEYKVRSKYISDFFYDNAIKGTTVIDLACGTGSIGACLEKSGYNIIGVDLSEEMLCVASSKCSNASFICADMTSFELPEKADACVCSLDSINHLKDINEVKSCFSCVNSSLKEGGIFIFDVNTVYKHNFILSNNTFVFDEEDFFLSWDNELLSDNVVRILLDFFVFNGKSYDRFSEEIYEKAYEIEELENALENFKIIGIYDDLKKTPPSKESERIYFVCKKE